MNFIKKVTNLYDIIKLSNSLKTYHKHSENIYSDKDIVSVIKQSISLTNTVSRMLSFANSELIGVKKRLVDWHEYNYPNKEFKIERVLSEASEYNHVLHEDYVNAEIKHKSLNTLKSALVGGTLYQGFAINTANISDVVDVNENAYNQAKEVFSLSRKNHRYIKPLTEVFSNISISLGMISGLVSARFKLQNDIAIDNDKLMDNNKHKEEIGLRLNNFSRSINALVADARNDKTNKKAAINNGRITGLGEVAVFYFILGDVEASKACINDMLSIDVKNTLRETGVSNYLISKTLPKEYLLFAEKIIKENNNKVSSVLKM